MLKVLSVTGVSTVPAADADVEVGGWVLLVAVGVPGLRKPTAHTAIATAASTSTMTTASTIRLPPPSRRVPRSGAYCPPAYCVPGYCAPPYPAAAGNAADGGWEGAGPLGPRSGMAPGL